MKISKENFQKAIEVTKPGVAGKEQIEQATSFVFKGEKVITYNDEISISHPVEGLGIEGGVKAEELYKLLGKLKKDEIDMSTQGNEVILKAGRAKAGFTLQEEIKLPLDEIGDMGKWKKLPEDFCKYIKFAMSACSKDFSDPKLTCVSVSQKGFVDGSDNYKITHCTLNSKMPVKSFLLPAASANEVIKLDPIKVSEGEGWIHFQNNEGTIISCRTFSEEYPDLSKHMDVEGELIEFPKNIQDIIDKATVFSKRNTILDERINIEIGSKKMKIKSESEAGRFEEQSPIRYDGDSISFAIAPYLISDILKETRKCLIGEDKIRFAGEGWEYVSAMEMI